MYICSRDAAMAVRRDVRRGADLLPEGTRNADAWLSHRLRELFILLLPLLNIFHKYSASFAIVLRGFCRRSTAFNHSRTRFNPDIRTWDKWQCINKFSYENISLISTYNILITKCFSTSEIYYLSSKFLLSILVNYWSTSFTYSSRASIFCHCCRAIVYKLYRV